MHNPAPAPLVGRTAELAALTAALDQAQRGRGSVHFVVGEGGIGKTRLALAVHDAAAANGFARVIGRAYPVETGVPYALFGDAFVPMLRAMPASMLQVLARGAVAELATLFPALRADGIAARELDEDELKPRLLDAFARFLQRLSQREPLLVVLENLHWADPSSLELLHFIARSAAAHRIVFLCTYDDTKRDANATLRATEQSLRSINALDTHVVPALTIAETGELVRGRFGAPVDAVTEFVAQLHDRTRGNPFFIEETLNALVSSGRLREEGSAWTGWQGDSLEMPRTVRDAIDARLDRLSPDARRVATIAAVAGAQVPHVLLETLSSLGADALLTTIDELRHERIVAEVDLNGELGYEFTHPLLREALYTSLARARARALHADIADALERCYGPDSLAHADVLAVHFLAAQAAYQAQRARRYLVAAGSSALDRGANQEANDALEAALSLTTPDEPVGEDGVSRERVLGLLGRARQRLGDYAGASECWTSAAELASARGDARAVARLERRLGVAAYWTGRYDDAIAHYDSGFAAAERANDAQTAASLRLARSAVLLEVGRAAEAEADIKAALATARTIGAPALLSRVHHALQLLAIWRGPASAAREHGERALQFANAADDRSAAWAAEWGLAVHAGLIGDAPSAIDHLATATALADELRSPLLRLWTDEVALEYRSGTGDWDAAIALADRIIPEARAFSQRTLLPRLLVWSSLVRFGRGDFELATQQMNEAWELSGAERAHTGLPVNVHAVVPAHVARAKWHLAQQQYREALEVAERGLAVAHQTGYTAWEVHRLLPIAGEAALWIQDWPKVQSYGARLRVLAEQLGHSLGLAWADGCFALMRMLKGDKLGAIEPLDRAAQALEAIPFADHAARVRRKLVDCYYETGDTESALRELRRIHDAFVQMGARPALDETRAKMRELGARPPARTSVEGAGALTAREAEIARLVARRKSNKEIAAALDISARTVGTHLSNIFGKLGVDSRGALTDLVRDGGLDGAQAS